MLGWMRLGHCIVVVAVIAAAESLIADVAENEECGPGHRYTALAGEVQQVVTENGCYENESNSNEAVSEYAKVSMRATAQAKRDQAGREDKPEQDGVESSVTQQCCGEYGENDDSDWNHEAVDGACR